jgi:hypothetical protein
LLFYVSGGDGIRTHLKRIARATMAIDKAQPSLLAILSLIAMLAGNRATGVAEGLEIFGFLHI